MGTANSVTGPATDAQDRVCWIFTKEAGIEAVMADLLEGKDAMAPGYAPPSLNLNGVAVTISVTVPPTDPGPRTLYRYIDPGTKQGLASLAPGTTWSVKLNGVQPLSTVVVNWAFPSATGDRVPQVEIRLIDINGRRIGHGTSPLVTGFPAALLTQARTGDTYTLEFKNNDTAPVVSRDFTIKGGQNNTWVLLKAVGKEYLITAIAGKVKLAAYVRQLPGPGPTSQQLKHMVLLESWQGPIAIPSTPTPGP